MMSTFKWLQHLKFGGICCRHNIASLGHDELMLRLLKTTSMDLRLHGCTLKLVIGTLSFKASYWGRCLTGDLDSFIIIRAINWAWRYSNNANYNDVTKNSSSRIRLFAKVIQSSRYHGLNVNGRFGTCVMILIDKGYRSKYIPNGDVRPPWKLQDELSNGSHPLLNTGNIICHIQPT